MSRIIIATGNELKNSKGHMSAYNSDKPKKYKKEGSKHNNRKRSMYCNYDEQDSLPQREDGLDIMPAYKYIQENAPAMESSIMLKMSKAPYPVKVEIKGLPEKIKIKYMFIKREELCMDYSKAFTNNGFDSALLEQTITGYVFNACLKQMNDPSFIKDTIDKEKHMLLNAVQSEINTEYEINDRCGLFIDNGKVYSCTSMSKKYIDEFDGKWLVISDYIKVEKNSPVKPVNFIYMPEEKKDRIKKAVSTFKNAYSGLKVYSDDKPPYVEEINQKRSEIISKHNMLLDGKRIKDIFPNPKMYYMVPDTEKLYIETSVGTFSSCTGWASVEYEEKYSGEAAYIMSDAYQDILKKWNEAVEETGYHFTYNGGAGIMNAGATKVVVDNGNIKIGIEIEIKKNGDFMNLIPKVIKKMKKMFDDELKRRNKTKEEYMKKQMEDTEIHEDKKKLFAGKGRNIYAGDITQMMFLYVDKSGGRVTKANFDKFCKDRCHADDCQDIMMENMSRLQVMYDDGKHVFIGPKAKYMRLFVYERLGIDKDGVTKALKELEKKTAERRLKRLQKVESF